MSVLLHNPRLTVEVGERDHALGSETALVTLLEYGDYECPFCGAAHQSMKQVRQVVGDHIRYVYRHFPLTKIHPHAALAAESAEAAGAQGRFWEMHDLLFTNQDRLARQDLLAYAQLLELDLERFALELEQHTHLARVREDFMSGIRSGVNGTPTFFVNGIRHNGSFAPEDLIAAIRAAGDL